MSDMVHVLLLFRSKWCVFLRPAVSLSARHHLPPAALSRHPQGCLAFHVILNNEFISLNERAERQAPPTSLLPSQTFLRGSQSEPRIPSTSPLRTLPQAPTPPLSDL